MPTLDWIGKGAVVNHHHQVPYHLLKDVPDLSVGDPGTGNLIVEGDNLLALIWAARSNGRCLFLMPKGKNFQAIRAVIRK